MIHQISDSTAYRMLWIRPQFNDNLAILSVWRAPFLVWTLHYVIHNISHWNEQKLWFIWIEIIRKKIVQRNASTDYQPDVISSRTIPALIVAVHSFFSRIKRLMEIWRASQLVNYGTRKETTTTRRLEFAHWLSAGLKLLKTSYVYLMETEGNWGGERQSAKQTQRALVR